jgi:hypothetical protein
MSRIFISDFTADPKFAADKFNANSRPADN